MSTEQPCLFSISDWINFLNVRALELGNMVISKKARTKGELSIVIAVIAVIMASLFGMTNVYATKYPTIAIVLYLTILIVFSSIIIIAVKGKDKEFEKFCQIALRVPLISTHFVRSNGWHVRLPFGRLNPQHLGCLGGKIIKT